MSVKDNKKDHSKKIIRTSEKLSLFINYLSLIGIWFAIPSVSLLLLKDERWVIAMLILFSVFLALFICYIADWKALFPESAARLK